MPHGRTRLIAGGIAAAVLIAAVGFIIYRATGGGAKRAAPPAGSASGSKAGGAGGGSGPGSTAPAPPGLKPAITGLIDPFGYPPATLVSSRAVDAFVVMAYWRDLQPQAGGPLVHPNPIDRAIQQARASGTGIGVKIRFFAGSHSPDWVLNLDGPPVAIGPGAGTSGGTVPRFWTPRFAEAYADIQTKLSAAYDSVPEVRETTMSACMTIFAEPFIRQAEQQATRQSLLAAGYSDSANRTCLRQSIQAQLVWMHTRSSMAFNPYQEINPDGTWRTDEAVTESFMDQCRQTLGPRCVLENNSVRAPIVKLGAAYGRMYAHMRQLGPPITLQTATPERIGCLVTSQCPAGVQAVLDWAVTERASALELPSDLTRYAAGVLQPYDGRLNANLAAATPR